METFWWISAAALTSRSHGLFSGGERQADAEVFAVALSLHRNEGWAAEALGPRGSERWEIKEANAVSERRVSYQQLPDIVTALTPFAVLQAGPRPGIGSRYFPPAHSFIHQHPPPGPPCGALRKH